MGRRKFRGKGYLCSDFARRQNFVRKKVPEQEHRGGLIFQAAGQRQPDVVRDVDRGVAVRHVQVESGVGGWVVGGCLALVVFPPHQLFGDIKVRSPEWWGLDTGRVKG